MPFLIRKPIDGVSRISEEQGNRSTHPVTGEPNKPHDGIDLVPAGIGENALKVYAAHDGEVIFSGRQIKKDKKGNPILDDEGNVILVGYGNYIDVKAADGTITRYAHLSRRLVAKGDKIGTGPGMVTNIGIAGNTGGSTGLHLHFEIILSDGKTRKNPREYLSEAFPDYLPTTVDAGKLQGDLYGDQNDNTLIGNSRPNNMFGLSGSDTYYVNFGDTIIDPDRDGRIIIADDELKQSTLLEGNAEALKDASGNPIPNKWSLDGFFSKTQFQMKNLISSLLLVLIFSSQSLAEETKSKTQNNTTQQVEEDPDLKLSIEELRKKYPIDWLAKKYGDYNENDYCRTDDCEDNCLIKPKNLVCAFYYDPFRIGYFEDTKKVSLDDFSESELKSIFVNYHQYYSFKISMGKEDTRFDDVVNVFIDYFMGKKSERLNAVEKKILKFAFSKQVLGSYEIQCANGKHYFHDKDYCNDRVGKGELKQKFQSLFSSKFNINLN